MKVLRFTVFLLLASLVGHAQESKKPSPLDRPARDPQAVRALALLPVQAGGRIKPLDTLARESLELFQGKESIGGRPPTEVFLSMLFNPAFWEEKEFLLVDYRPLKRDLGWSEEQRFFSIKILRNNEKLLPLMQELQNKEAASEKLEPYFQALARVRNQVLTYNMLISGKLLRLLPPKAGTSESAWVALDELADDQKVLFWVIAATFENEDRAVQARVVESVGKFSAMASAVNPALYPAPGAMETEAHYNSFRPFRKAWILALVAAVVLCASLMNSGRWLYWSGMGLFLATLAMEVYGFYLRILIAGRPPVTNMYESVIWVAFGTMVLGLILELIYRRRIVAIGSLVFAILCLILADTFTAILDESIQPLEPVLRSNFWLTIHVLTITMGYAAFALSMAVANAALAPFVVLGREAKHLPLNQMSLYAYRAVQVGVILLGAGTILGGVWADYSWGRFWGWDPKETWALIAFLGYVALLHARFRGMLKHFGFLAGCIIAFLLVLMAWYGVNFVLGAGLHSYGFSSGGNSGMFIYCILQLAFVSYAIYFYRKRLPKQG